MAGIVMNQMHGSLSAVVAAALMVAACSPRSGDEAARPPLAGATIGGPFTLIDQHGRQISDRSFAGKYRIMYFGYTYCPDVCPTDMQHLGAALRLLDRQDPALAKRVVPIFRTVDPTRDTPAVLGAFVSAFSPRMVGLTGSADAIARVASEYRIFYEKQPPTPDGGYIVEHSNIAYLMSPDNHPLAQVPVAGAPEAIVATIERWAR
jgi:protein SCO1/2